MNGFKRILLAEDNYKDVDLTLAALAEYNLVNEVVVARDGTEALDYLRREGEYRNRPPGLPAVVLLDIRMPRLSGLEVLRQMKSEPALKNIPVVMLTSSSDEPDLAASYALGANAYVTKPIDFAGFVDAIRQVGIFWAMVNEPPSGSIPPPPKARPLQSS